MYFTHKNVAKKYVQSTTKNILTVTENNDNY